MSQPPKTRSFEPGQRNEILDHRACGRRCACPGGWSPSCVSEPIGLAEAALDRFHAGDERGADRADAGNQDAQLSVGGRNLDVILWWTTAESPYELLCPRTDCAQIRRHCTG